MIANNYNQADIAAVSQYLNTLLSERLENSALNWLDDKLSKVKSLESGKDFYMAFSAAPRFTGNAPLSLSHEELKEAGLIRKGFYPVKWTFCQAARTLLILALPKENKENYLGIINNAFEAADVNELVALYGSLPLLNYPEDFRLRCAEGIRTNMTVVFESIAMHNPYPAEYLEEAAWNQMILKTVFIGKPLYKIYGLDKRNNKNLATMLTNYAHERWAASRTVTPELWRLVGPFIDETNIDDIKRLFSHPDTTLHEAAALACSQSNSIGAQHLLKQYPQLYAQILSNQLTWNHLGEFAEVKV